MGFFNATSTYGKGFQPTDNSNEFKIKIYTGGLAFKNTATKKLKSEIDKFIQSSDFKAYEIIDSKFEWIPSGFKFLVKFS